MFAKVFAQILDSSLAEDYQTRHVFEDLLKLCDANGVVDMTPEAIARRTNVPQDIVNRALDQLQKPDPRSRNPDSGGARLVRLDEHRDWGWFIVNHDYYRRIASDEQRREKTAQRVERYRALHPSRSGNAVVTHGNAAVTPTNAGNAMQNQKQMQMQMQNKDVGQIDNPQKPAGAGPTSKPTESQWLEGLKADPAYQGIDVGREYGKMKQWCTANHRQPTRRRFVNWLNRCDRPIDSRRPGAVPQFTTQSIDPKTI